MAGRYEMILGGNTTGYLAQEPAMYTTRSTVTTTVPATAGQVYIQPYHYYHAGGGTNVTIIGEKVDVKEFLKTLPGQKTAKTMIAASAKYKTVTQEDLWKILGCEEIERLENAERKSRAYALAKAEGTDVIEDGYGWHVLNGFVDRKVKGMGKFKETISKVNCSVDMLRLEDWSADIIPDEALAKVEEAHDMGIREFYVAFPRTTEIKKDPVIVGRVGGKDFLIAQWGL